VSLVHSNIHWCLYSSNCILFIPWTHKCVVEVTEEERGRNKIKRGQRIRRPPESSERKIWSWVLLDSGPRINMLARTSSNLAVSAFLQNVYISGYTASRFRAFPFSRQNVITNWLLKEVRQIKSSPQINLAVSSMRAGIVYSLTAIVSTTAVRHQ
jgi:hypothetical protein